jgi:hypothetical protein
MANLLSVRRVVLRLSGAETAASPENIIQQTIPMMHTGIRMASHYYCTVL